MLQKTVNHGTDSHQKNRPPGLEEPGAGQVLMPLVQWDFPPYYKNQPLKLRNKAVEIANELLINGAEEGVAIATGLKKGPRVFAKGKTTTARQVKKKKVNR